jgi:hypothetical protein
MLQHLDLDPMLLVPGAQPLQTPSQFAASLNAHGTYSTLRFVVRLSPKIHRLIDNTTSGIYDAGEIDGETFQAFSTYLHETVHWWQHVGSTAGLILSLVYPAETHQNVEHLRTALRIVGPKKSLLRWAENALRNGATHVKPELAAANSAVNNAIDIEFYKSITFDPPSVIDASESPYFESLGHCYWMAYGHTVALLSATVDREIAHLPDGRNWDEGFRRAREAKIDGFTYRGSVSVAPLGIHALFEGQARFLQLQYLTFGVQEAPTCQELRAAKYFEGIYGEAFEMFLKITDAEWPLRIDDPAIGLFLLTIDLAINPTVGFPFDITSFENFIIDVDPGIRFLRLCHVIRRQPELLTAITQYSREEYTKISRELAEACGYDSPITALELVARWATTVPGIEAIMAKKETFKYQRDNLVVRVLFSHFVSFCTDKFHHPEFFCWVGAWMAGHRVNENSQHLFLSNLSLYTDSADSDEIFPRRFPGKDERALVDTLSIFYGNIIVYDLTQQWILNDGPFKYDYAWLSETHSKEKMTEWANNYFQAAYKVHPDDFEILKP